MTKILSYSTDRETNPLMKDLHGVAVKHDKRFVVFAWGKDGATTLLIDREDDTHPLVASKLYSMAGVTLIKASSGLEEYHEEQRQAGNGCGRPFDDGGKCGDQDGDAMVICGSCSDLLATKEEHGDHGRGDIESGPDDPDCPCRGTAKTRDCARAGCGFCTVEVHNGRNDAE